MSREMLSGSVSCQATVHFLEWKFEPLLMTQSSLSLSTKFLATLLILILQHLMASLISAGMMERLIKANC